MEKNFESLNAWQKSATLVELVYSKVLPALPTEEKYSMALQLRRAVQSIPANIAEGYDRYYFQESIRFCYVARGSLAEVKNFILIGKRLRFIEESVSFEVIAEVNELYKLLNGYIAFLKKSKRGIDEPGYKTNEGIDNYGDEIDKNTVY